MTLTLSEVEGEFRWEKRSEGLEGAELFLRVESDRFSQQPDAADAIDIQFDSQIGRSAPWGTPAPKEIMRQRDRLVALEAERRGNEFRASKFLSVGWCSFSAPALKYGNRNLPFHYHRSFAAIDDVCSWVRQNPRSLIRNAAHVDGIIARNEVVKSVNNLMAQTLHSWLVNTWWTTEGDADRFTVWEGSCYFHSTVDVEFTQAPFYLTLWPELLAIQLDFWASFARSAGSLVGQPKAKFLSHDVGVAGEIGGQVYPHDMEVEESANYLILMFAYWQRTGDETLIERHQAFLRELLTFLVAADTAGDGVPRLGVSNTIDDASPAVQFGQEQVYLAIKTLAALECGIRSMREESSVPEWTGQAAKLRQTLTERAWAGTHFRVLLKSSGRMKDPWTGQQKEWDVIPGWDACHIYSANTLPILDMIGFDLDLDEKRIKLDLVHATRACLREYGCTHTDYIDPGSLQRPGVQGLAGAARSPGWISMNILRDLAALYRGVHTMELSDRYWEWQTLTNTQAPKLFFETFGGNNLCYYPRGVVIWGYFEAVSRTVINRVERICRQDSNNPLTPALFTADWQN